MAKPSLSVERVMRTLLGLKEGDGLLGLVEVVEEVREGEGRDEAVEVACLVAHDDDPVVGVVAPEVLEKFLLWA